MKTVLTKDTEQIKLVAKLSDDRLKLFVDVEPKTIPEDWNRDSFIAELGGEVVLEYLHNDVIDDILVHLRKGEKIKERRIAKGVEAKHGEDGRSVFLVKKMTPIAEIIEDSRGYVDFRQLHRFENVRKGTVVAKVFPPNEGTNGRDPLGKELPAKKGKPLKVQTDKTITQRESSSIIELVAELDGFLSDESGRLSIQEELRVSGDVDFQIGSIDFIGQVVIRGDVLPGFIVRGQKGVSIKGAVQEASIFSSDGDITLDGYSVGTPVNRVAAGGKVICRVAHHLEIEAGKDIEVQKEARDCDMRTKASLLAKEALIIGGQAHTACGLEAKEIGATAGTRTLVSLSDDRSLTSEFQTLRDQITKHEKALALINLHVGPLSVQSKSVPEHLKERLNPLLKKKAELTSSMAELLRKRDAMMTEARSNHVFRVNFHKRLHPGVVVHVGTHEYANKETHDGPKTLQFEPATEKFEIVDLQPLECSLKEEEKPKGKDDARNKTTTSR